jgi:ABC-2 type transport system ATP-binding protein
VVAEVPDTAPVLEARHLVKRYGERTVVDDVSFGIGSGETYGLLGPNGAGKTTTISMVCGLLRADGGTVTVAGRLISSHDVGAKAAVGLVPQDLALYPDLTARENLLFFGRLQRMDAATLRRRVDEVLAVVGLADRADDRVETYSGGMKRRANIGAGLLHEPRLLILDEPTVGVDPQSRNAILQSIEDLGGAGLSVLYTTHYMEEAERLCDRIGIIDEGRLVAEGSRADLVARVGQHTHVVVEGYGDLDAFVARVRSLPVVLEASRAPGGADVVVEHGGRAVQPLVDAAEDVGLVLTGVDVKVPDLEAVFLTLTGKALRD